MLKKKKHGDEDFIAKKIIILRPEKASLIYFTGKDLA